jgi:tape measure domain-containing protein
MQTLGASAEDSQEALNTLSDNIDGLPTSLDQAALSVQRFQAKTKDIKKSTEYFTAINDAILAGGANSATASAALEQFIQMYSKGKVQGQEWLSVMTAMPGQMQQIAESFGYTSTAVGGDFYLALQDGVISMDQFMDKLVELDKYGGENITSFRDQAYTATGGIGTALTNVKNRISKGLAEIIGALDEALAEYGGIAGVINKFSTKIKDALVSVANYLKTVDFKSLFNTIKAIAPVLLTIAGYIMSISSALKIYKGVMAGVQVVQALLNSTMFMPIAIIGAVIAAIVLLYTKCEWFRDLVNSVIENLKPLLQSLWDMLKPMFDNLVVMIKNIWVVAEPILKVLLTAVVNTINFIIQVINDVIKVITWLINKFNEAKSKVSNATSGIRNAVVGGFSEMLSKVKNIGSNIIDGLIGGITGGAQKLYNKCKEVGKKALNKIKETLGIHSPSTEFAMVGKFSMLGFEKGLMDMQPEIDKAINSMFTLNPSLTGTMNNSMSPNINVVNNVNLETDPLGQVVNKIKTYSGGAKNDYNWGTGL